MVLGKILKYNRKEDLQEQNNGQGNDSSTQTYEKSKPFYIEEMSLNVIG